MKVCSAKLICLVGAVLATPADLSAAPMRSLVASADLGERLQEYERSAVPTSASSSQRTQEPLPFATVRVGALDAVACGPYLPPSPYDHAATAGSDRAATTMVAGARLMERFATLARPTDQTARLVRMRDLPADVLSDVASLFARVPDVQAGSSALYFRVGIQTSLLAKELSPRPDPVILYFPPYPPMNDLRPVPAVGDLGRVISDSRPEVAGPRKPVFPRGPLSFMSVNSDHLVMSLASLPLWGVPRGTDEPRFVNRRCAERAVAVIPRETLQHADPVDMTRSVAVAFAFGEREVDGVIYVGPLPGTPQWFVMREPREAVAAYQRMVRACAPWTGRDWQRALESSLSVGPTPISLLPPQVVGELTRQFYPRVADRVRSRQGRPWYEGVRCLCTLRALVGLRDLGSLRGTRQTVLVLGSASIAHTFPTMLLPDDLARSALAALQVVPPPTEP